MANQKKPLHEVLMTKLALAVVGITGDLASAKVVEVMTILDVLHKGKMKATDAHMVAELHTGLPELLKFAGQTKLAALAALTLDDLKGREDEKKQERSEEAAGTQ